MGDEARITRIPFEGGSGRIKTGALQFQDDWPGLFVRGDDAIAVAQSIRQLQQRLKECDDVVIFHSLARLEAIARIIERDVIVR